MFVNDYPLCSLSTRVCVFEAKLDNKKVNTVLSIQQTAFHPFFLSTKDILLLLWILVHPLKLGTYMFLAATCK